MKIRTVKFFEDKGRVFVRPVTDATCPQRERGLPEPTPSRARFAAPSAEETPAASSARPGCAWVRACNPRPPVANPGAERDMAVGSRPAVARAGGAVRRAAGPRVCRLTAGAKEIRTLRPALNASVRRSSTWDLIKIEWPPHGDGCGGRDREFADSPLEEAGFEPSVPPYRETPFAAWRSPKASILTPRGTNRD